LWVEAWRKKVATGTVVVVRYADDLVLGFENRADAERFLAEFRERLAKFGLELHADKTRLIEFGRYAARNRQLPHGRSYSQTDPASQVDQHAAETFDRRCRLRDQVAKTSGFSLP
jgi:Reverse transcriptase (RNA-dependent DNA polymerase)